MSLRGVERGLAACADAAAWLAAGCMVALLAVVWLSILGRQLHFHVPGTEAYAGYLMAAAGFLALAQTLARGEHIRVTLVLERLRGRARRAFEIAAGSLAALLGVLLAVYSVRLAWLSWKLQDISTASDATPLWIPQLAMAGGTLLFAAALLARCLRLAIDPRAAAGAEAATRHE